MVGGLGGRVDGDVGEVGAGGQIKLLEAVHDGATLESEAPADGVDPRIRSGESRRDVDLERHLVAHAPLSGQLRIATGCDGSAVEDRRPRPCRES